MAGGLLVAGLPLVDCLDGFSWSAGAWLVAGPGMAFLYLAPCRARGVWSRFGMMFLGPCVRVLAAVFWFLHFFGRAAAQQAGGRIADQKIMQNTDYIDTGPGRALSGWRRVFGVRPDPASAFEGSAARGLGGQPAAAAHWCHGLQKKAARLGSP